MIILGSWPFVLRLTLRETPGEWKLWKMSESLSALSLTNTCRNLNDFPLEPHHNFTINSANRSKDQKFHLDVGWTESFQLSRSPNLISMWVTDRFYARFARQVLRQILGGPTRERDACLNFEWGWCIEMGLEVETHTGESRSWVENNSRELHTGAKGAEELRWKCAKRDSQSYIRVFLT